MQPNHTPKYIVLKNLILPPTHITALHIHAFGIKLCFGAIIECSNRCWVKAVSHSVCPDFQRPVYCRMVAVQIGCDPGVMCVRMELAFFRKRVL